MFADCFSFNSIRSGGQNFLGWIPSQCNVFVRLKFSKFIQTIIVAAKLVQLTQLKEIFCISKFTWLQ